MMEHPDPRLWSGFLDGDLSREEAEGLDLHLDECDDCSRLLQDLQDIRTTARELPDRFPERDLWPGIEKAIGEGWEETPDVIRLHPGLRSPSSRRGRRIRMSIPQAVAAGLALAMFSGVVGSRVGGGPALQAGTGAGVDSPTAGAQWVSRVEATQPALRATAQEVARLEELLGEHRSELDPVTAQIIQKNLGVIDKAIGESIEALQADPGNRFLESNLRRAVIAKGDYLREATLLVTPVS